MVVFGLGKNFLFKSALGHCGGLRRGFSFYAKMCHVRPLCTQNANSPVAYLKVTLCIYKGLANLKANNKEAFY